MGERHGPLQGEHGAACGPRLGEGSLGLTTGSGVFLWTSCVPLARLLERGHDLARADPQGLGELANIRRPRHRLAVLPLRDDARPDADLLGQLPLRQYRRPPPALCGPAPRRSTGPRRSPRPAAPGWCASRLVPAMVVPAVRPHGGAGGATRVMPVAELAS